MFPMFCQVEIKEAPDTERTPEVDMSVTHSDSNVVVVAGSLLQLQL